MILIYIYIYMSVCVCVCVRARTRMRVCVMHCFEQILKAAPHKTAAVWLFTSHQTKHPYTMNKTCWALLGNYGRTYKRRSLMNSYGHTAADRPAGTYIHWLCAEIGISLVDSPGAKEDWDGWWERVNTTWWWWWWWWW